MEIVCSLFKVCSRPHLHLLLFGDLRDKNKGRLLFIGGGGGETLLELKGLQIQYKS